jgi:hypothetical protein
MILIFFSSNSSISTRATRGSDFDREEERDDLNEEEEEALALKVSEIVNQFGKQHVSLEDLTNIRLDKHVQAQIANKAQEEQSLFSKVMGLDLNPSLNVPLPHDHPMNEDHFKEGFKSKFAAEFAKKILEEKVQESTEEKKEQTSPQIEEEQKASQPEQPQPQIEKVEEAVPATTTVTVATPQSEEKQPEAPVEQKPQDPVVSPVASQDPQPMIM